MKSTHHIFQAKVTDSPFLHGGLKDDVEMIADIVSQTEQNLHHGLVVLHVELNGASGNGPWGTVPDSILAAARESAEFIFVETTDFGALESEMGGDERKKEKEQGGSDGRLHVCDSRRQRGVRVGRSEEEEKRWIEMGAVFVFDKT